MNEWKRIISDRKRLVLMLCIPVVCFALFFYQSAMDAMQADPQEYRALVDEWRYHAPEDILAALSEKKPYDRKRKASEGAGVVSSGVS